MFLISHNNLYCPLNQFIRRGSACIEIFLMMFIKKYCSDSYDILVRVSNSAYLGFHHRRTIDLITENFSVVFQSVFLQKLMSFLLFDG